MGRCLEWEEVERRQEQSPSTLIVQDSKAQGRVFWTPDDVLARNPFPSVQGSDLFMQCSNLSTGRVNHPFALWCFFHYVSEDTGSAFLTELPDRYRDHVEALFWHEVQGHAEKTPVSEHSVFRHMQVIFVPYLSPSRKCLRRFVDLLEAEPEHTGSNLAGVLDGEDRSLVQMALEALRILGPRAQPALAALVTQFYYGPWEQRHAVAEVLAAIGTEGVQVLKEASGKGDPFVSRPAATALALADSREKHARVSPDRPGPGRPASN